MTLDSVNQELWIVPRSIFLVVYNCLRYRDYRNVSLLPMFIFTSLEFYLRFLQKIFRSKRCYSSAYFSLHDKRFLKSTDHFLSLELQLVFYVSSCVAAFVYLWFFVFQYCYLHVLCTFYDAFNFFTIPDPVF